MTMDRVATDYEYFSSELDRLEHSGNLRTLHRAEHDGNYITVDGNRMLNLSSNDYLGLAADGSLFDTFINSLPGEGIAMSSSSSRLLTGNYDEFECLEQCLAKAFGTESALLFNSGYNMNIGILPAVSDASTIILADKLVHASIIDGLRLSAARCIRYRHMDYGQLERLADKYAPTCPQVIIVTESIFSMDGDVADLTRLAAIKKKHGNVMLYVDEAHAVGVRGANGLGIAEEQGCIGDIDFLCGTFGKALCSMGAYVVCRRVVRDYLINKMRSFIFTTALPPMNVAWTTFVFRRLPDFGVRRKHLDDLSCRLRGCISAMTECHSSSHIVPLIIGSSEESAKAASRLQAKGFYVLPLRPPTVPDGTSRLRFSLTAGITDMELTHLIKALQQ